jgi:ABC-2 type transport system ATP-binding protein
VKTYSGGMRRRLEIARGLIHYPKILFLDEPTLGLDPQTREHVWEYIKQLAEKEKITVILTTHYMEEADLLCDRIAIIDHGKIIALDTSLNLKNSLGGDSIILTVSNAKNAKKIFPKSKIFDGKIILSVKNAERQIAKILDKVRENRIEIKEVNIHKPSLNEVFLHLTGREIREETVNSKDRMRFRFRGH